MDKLRTLMTARRLVLEADEAWENYSDEQTAAALAKIEELDGDLLALEFDSPETKMLALEMLLIGDDQPNFADHFKNQLFDRLRDFRSR